MLKIQRYQDTHLPLIRNRFSFGKPDHFPIPSNCAQSTVAGNALQCTFSPAARHGSTGAPTGCFIPPKTWDHRGVRGMLPRQEHPAVPLAPCFTALGVMLMRETSHLDGETPGANPAARCRLEMKTPGCCYF